MSDNLNNKLNWVVTQNFFKGMLIQDFISNSIASRKGCLATSLETANAGTLTKKLYEFSQDIIIREQNCFSDNVLKENKFFINISGSYIINNLSLIEDNNEIDSKYIKSSKRRDLDYNFYIKNTHFYRKNSLTCLSLTNPCFFCLNLKKNFKFKKLNTYPLGLISSHTLSEPTTQLNLSLFHGGGTIQEKNSGEDDLIVNFNKSDKLNCYIKSIVLNPNSKFKIGENNLKYIKIIDSVKKKIKQEFAIKTFDIYKNVINHYNYNNNSILNFKHIDFKVGDTSYTSFNFFSNNKFIIFKDKFNKFKKINLDEIILKYKIDVKSYSKNFKFNFNVNNLKNFSKLNSNFSVLY
eukprot:GHVN01097517.1.p2 GENE.GHVN01097517.1~~GHVN01097517.1.p2  ORF type:complete len:350 (+),score=-11.67 GHVN01097517.1:2699-3748(+)